MKKHSVILPLLLCLSCISNPPWQPQSTPAIFELTFLAKGHATGVDSLLLTISHGGESFTERRYRYTGTFSDTFNLPSATLFTIRGRGSNLAGTILFEADTLVEIGTVDYQSIPLALVLTAPGPAFSLSTIPGQAKVGEIYSAITGWSIPRGVAASSFLDTAPRGMTILDSLISWKPDTADTGKHPVRIVLSDPWGRRDTLTGEISVSLKEANRAPFFMVGQGNMKQLVQAGDSLKDTIFAVHPDGDNALMTSLQLPSGARFESSADGLKGFIAWQTLVSDTGSHTFRVRVRDMQDSALGDVFSWDVTVFSTSGPREPPDGMVLINARDSLFLMGDSVSGQPSEKPVHAVRFTFDFYLGTTEVNQADYDSVMTSAYQSSGKNNKWDPINGIDGSLPAYNITWFEAALYCNARSAAEGLTSFYDLYNLEGSFAAGITAGVVSSIDTADGYRLPTEAQWEYAARSGTLQYPYGTGMGILSDKTAWYGSSNWEGPEPVKSYPPNAFGLYEMSGNVREWCQDWYDPDYYSGSPALDPAGPSSGETRVNRGGSWKSDSSLVRCASRGNALPGSPSPYLGFRVLLPAPR